MATSRGIQRTITNGLTICLDANNPRSYPGHGTVWRDISGNANHFEWDTEPTFTRGAGPNYFKTYGNLCVGPASNSVGISNSSGYTIVIACYENSGTNGHAFKFFKDGSGVGTRAIASHLLWSGGVAYFDQGGCCGTDTRLSADVYITQAWAVWMLTRETKGSTRTIYRNGSQLAKTTDAAADISPNSTAINLGGSDEYGGTSSVWNARLGAFMVYNRDLQPYERTRVFDILRTRYGI